MHKNNFFYCFGKSEITEDVAFSVVYKKLSQGQLCCYSKSFLKKQLQP